MSICSLEDIAEHTDRHPFWFQLYVMRDKAFMERLIDRAKAANCSALVVTLDLQILGSATRTSRTACPPRPSPRWQTSSIWRPSRTGAWECWVPSAAASAISSAMWMVWAMSSLSSWTADQFDPSLNWSDVEWIKKLWGGKMILKGMMDAEDARLAAKRC
jgi:L-lactate dehydrogenase (cytochrome)